MLRKMGDILAERAAGNMVGREAELALLLAGLEGEGPLVTQVHGIAGIGKSTLINAFAARVGGASVVRLDCRAMEPTETGFLAALGAALGAESMTLPDATDRLASLDGTVVLALESYELYRLLDTWLRQVFVPALPDNVRVMLIGRYPPSPGWTLAPEWDGLFHSLELGPLGEAPSRDLLEAAGVDADEARRINRFAHGHPLALKLIGAAARGRPGLDLGEASLHRAILKLAHLYLDDIDDPLLRQGVEAAAVVRRTTRSILAAMIPEAADGALHDRLRQLPFVDSGRHGLFLNDPVRDAIAAELRSADPSRFRDYRRAVWRQLLGEMREAQPDELWRYTADTIYLIDNPVVREAFFPSSSTLFTVEPAREQHAAEIRALTERHDGPAAAELIDHWWSKAPQGFHIARDANDDVVGYYQMFDPAELEPAWLDADPILAMWRRQLEADRIPVGQHALFLRRWLSRDEGEAPSPVQAACWLDIKRSYMEMRPDLRRVYLTLRDIAPYAPVAQQLGFQPLADASAAIGNHSYGSAMLDFGPASVDGWIARLVAAELELEDDSLLDRDRRELVLDDRRVRLTPLEFGVMQYLTAHPGEAVSRDDLLDEVWGIHHDGASNVVDTVIAGLRRKLAAQADSLETVRGVGYLYRGRVGP